MVTRKLIFRLAEDSEGETLKNLCNLVGYNIPGDWSRVHPYWIVAESNGLILGAIQVCPGLPVGRLEFLAVEPEVSSHLRGRLVRGLVLHGSATLKRMGADGAAGSVPFEMKSYKRVLKKRGAVMIMSGNTFMKRLS